MLSLKSEKNHITEFWGTFLRSIFHSSSACWQNITFGKCRWFILHDSQIQIWKVDPILKELEGTPGLSTLGNAVLGSRTCDNCYYYISNLSLPSLSAILKDIFWELKPSYIENFAMMMRLLSSLSLFYDQYKSSKVLALGNGDSRT